MYIMTLENFQEDIPKSLWQKAPRTVFTAGDSSTEGQFWQAGLGNPEI